MHFLLYMSVSKPHRYRAWGWDCNLHQPAIGTVLKKGWSFGNVHTACLSCGHGYQGNQNMSDPATLRYG